MTQTEHVETTSIPPTFMEKTITTILNFNQFQTLFHGNKAGLMSNTSDQSPMDKSLLLVVPIDPMVKIFTVREMSVKWGNIILLCTDWGSYL